MEPAGPLRAQCRPLRRLAAAVGAVLACLAAGSARAEDYSPAAKRVLSAARAASGGAGWNSLRAWHEVGRQDGLPYERWVDPVRYGVRMEVRGPEGLTVHAFNGAADWRIDPSGVLSGADDRATVARARTTAFFSAYGYFFPSRYSGRGSHLGVRRNKGRAFDVLSLQPGGGEPRELWFDHRTHLLARIVDRTRLRPVTVDLSDYRRVGPVLAPFHFSLDDGVPAHRQERTMERLDFPPADRALFSAPPKAPAVLAEPAAETAPPPAKPPPTAKRRSWIDVLKRRRSD